MQPGAGAGGVGCQGPSRAGGDMADSGSQHLVPPCARGVGNRGCLQLRDGETEALPEVNVSVSVILSV